MTIKKLGVFSLVLGMMLLMADTAFGTVEAFLRIEGVSGKFKIDALLTDWAQVQGMPDPHAPSSGKGGAGGAQSGKVGFTDFTISKETDKSSPALLLACTQGKHFPRVTIEFYRAGERKKAFLKIVMTDVVISGIKPAGGRLEKVTFKSAKKIEWKYTTLKKKALTIRK